MSEAVFQPRVRVTRVRSLGDAVPIGSGPFADTGDDEKIVANTGDELRAERDAARDAQPMTTTCRVETCDFAYTGTAGDCRDAAATHRAASHPELAGARTHRSGIRFKRRGETIDPAIVAESRRLRQERDDQARLDTIERGRAARGLLEEAAPRGDVGAASSSSRLTRLAAGESAGPSGHARVEPGHGPVATEELRAPRASQPAASLTHIQEGNEMTTCKIDGCDGDASSAPQAGPTAKLCDPHRKERSAALSESRRGKRRGNPAPAPLPAVAPAPTPVLALRDPIRTADIPYDADVLEREAAFLRNRAACLDQIAGAIRTLGELNEERAA